MAKNPKRKDKQTDRAQDAAALKQKIDEAVSNAIDQYKAENPDADVESILSEQKLIPVLGQLSNRELDKFIANAKEQGTKMTFDAMEMGVLSAGRKDMQNGLAEIINSMKFDQPTCPECGEGMTDRGRGKKNS